MGKDYIRLALADAAQDLGLPSDEAQKILDTLLQFQETHSIWPKGFM